MTPWQVHVAQARMAGPVFEQRAYKAPSGNVRFYPSASAREYLRNWYITHYLEEDCIDDGHTRLPDTEARAIWATRPEGMK